MNTKNKSKYQYLGENLYNDTDIFCLVHKATRIVFLEFIATDFIDYCINNNIRFVDYLQKRKEYICKSRNYSPELFGVSYKNYGYETYNFNLMCE
jgi:hypothetical protein